MELHGKTILITRAASNAGSLSSGLRQLGARVLECPAIEIVPIEGWRVDLSSYQWLLFTSANAVDCFMKGIQSPCTLPIAAVGSATSSRLAAWHLTASLVPEEFRAEGLLKVFPADMTGQRVLFPRAETARELLPEELRRRGATVDVLPVYRTVKASGTEELRQTLAGEKIDCAVFTSTSTVQFMAEALGEAFIPILRDVPIAVIGPITRDAAIAVGLRPSIEPQKSTVPDLIDAIRQYFN